MPLPPAQSCSWYVIYRMLRHPEHKHRTIVLAIQEANQVFVIPPTGPLRKVSMHAIGLDAFSDLRDLGAEPLFIADSLLPPVLSIPTLVVSSPGRLANRDLRNMLNSYSQSWCYMLVPTEEEVLQMNKACYDGKDEAGVKHRMKLWGPIPRHVLVYTSPSQQRQAWTTAASVPLDTLVALARGHATGNAGIGDRLDAPHRLVHERAAGQDATPGTPEADINSLEYYARGKVALASPAMMRYLAQRLIQEGNWNAKFLIDASVGIGPLGALRGLKFEELVLKMLEDGTEFECRRLRKGGHRVAKRSAARAAAAIDEEEEGEGDDTRTVQSTPRVVWSSTSELPPHRSTPSLLVPRVRNEAGLDALIWDPDTGHHWPLDCTVAEQHGVHARGVSDAVRALGWTPAKGWPDHGARKGVRHIKYFWVLPEDRFKDWWSPQAAKEGSDGSLEAKEAFDKLRQYALCVTASASTRQVEKVLKEQGVQLPIEMVGGSGGDGREDGR